MKPEIELLLWTVEQVSEACGLSIGQVRKEIREGRLAIRKVGRLTRIERPALDAWIGSLPAKNEVSGRVDGRSGVNSTFNYPVENIAGDLR